MKRYLIGIILVSIVSFFAGIQYRNYQFLKGYWFAFNETGVSIRSNSYEVYDKYGNLLYQK